MKADYLKQIVDINGLSKISQITTTSLIRVMIPRVKPGTFNVDVANEILSYVDNTSGETIIIDTGDVNVVTGIGTLELPAQPQP